MLIPASLPGTRLLVTVPHQHGWPQAEYRWWQWWGWGAESHSPRPTRAAPQGRALGLCHAGRLLPGGACICSCD